MSLCTKSQLHAFWECGQSMWYSMWVVLCVARLHKDRALSAQLLLRFPPCLSSLRKSPSKDYIGTVSVTHNILFTFPTPQLGRKQGTGIKIQKGLKTCNKDSEDKAGEGTAAQSLHGLEKRRPSRQHDCMLSTKVFK